MITSSAITRWEQFADRAKTESARARRRRMCAHIIDLKPASHIALVRAVNGGEDNGRDRAWLAQMERDGELVRVNGHLALPEAQNRPAIDWNALQRHVDSLQRGTEDERELGRRLQNVLDGWDDRDHTPEERI